MQTGGGSGPDFTQQLKLDLSNALVSSTLVKVLDRTPLTPRQIQGQPPAAQAQAISRAVGTYAAAKVKKAERLLAQEPDLARKDPILPMLRELQSLGVILEALPPEQRGQVARCHARLQDFSRRRLETRIQGWNPAPDVTADSLPASREKASFWRAFRLRKSEPAAPPDSSRQPLSLKEVDALGKSHQIDEEQYLRLADAALAAPDADLRMRAFMVLMKHPALASHLTPLMVEALHRPEQDFDMGVWTRMLSLLQPVPEPIYQALLADFHNDTPELWWRRSKAAFAMPAALEIPAGVRESLIQMYQTEKNPAKREALAYTLRRWMNAQEFLALLYPDQIAELSRLIPGLPEMHALNITDFKPQTIRDLIAYLSDAQSHLSPMEYRSLVNVQNLDNIRTKTIVSLPYSDYLVDRYRLPYPLSGVQAKRVDHGAVLASVLSGTATPDRGALAQAFQAFDALIDSNFQALDLIARHAHDLDKVTALSILRHTELMVNLYQDMEGPDPALEKKLQTISNDIKNACLGLPDNARLPKETAARVLVLESKTSLSNLNNLHTLINHVHQSSFEALAHAAHRAQATAILLINSLSIHFTDLSSEPLLAHGRIANPLLKLIASPDMPARGQVIIKDDQLWFHARLGVHSAEVHARLAAPDEGGMLQVRYSEGGDDEGNRLRLIYIADILKLLGAPINIRGGQFLDSFWDKDHGLLSKAQIETALPSILKALAKTANLDWALQGVTEHHGPVMAETVAKAMAEEWVAEGKVPYLVRVELPSSDDLYHSYMKYTQADTSRDVQRRALDRESARLGLPELPKTRRFGQEVIDRYFTRPVRLALARGELVMDPSGLPQRAAHRPIADLARAIETDEDAALRLAAALTAADTQDLAFETVGAIGRLQAQRAQWLWSPDDGITVYALRDPQSGALTHAQALHWDGRLLRQLDPPALEGLLQSKGIDTSLVLAPSWPQRQKWRRLLTLPPLGDDADSAAYGLAASAGKGSFATGRAEFRHDASGAKGRVFLTPYTTPDDMARMRRSAAVVTTGGGLLSHAAITTRELGVPAVILNRSRWVQERGGPALEISIDRPVAATRGPGGLWLVERLAQESLRIHEGDLLRVDGRSGRVTAFPDPAPNAAGAGAAMAEIHDLLAAMRSDEAVARLGRLRGPPQYAAARFLLEEALWNPDYAAQRAGLVSRLLDADPELRGQLQDYGQGLLRARVARCEEEAGPEDEDGLGHDIDRLRRGAEELTVLAAALQLDRAPLKPLQDRLAKLQELQDSLQQRAATVLESSLREFAHRLHDLTAKDLPELRALLRGVQAADIKDGLLALHQRAQELAGLKRNAARAERPSLVPLSDVDDDWAELVGGKSAKLGEIMTAAAQAGARVPPGLALTTEAYLRFLRETGREDKVMAQARKLDEYLSRADPASEPTQRWLRREAQVMQDLIRSGRLSEDRGLGREITAALSGRAPDGTMYAVRSSAVQEDRPEAAFAGAAETYLYVEPAEVLDKVVEDWASFWLPRGILYRWHQGIKSVDLRPAVTVQEMADVQAAGVMFTMDPVTGRRDIMINAAFGLGEGVVSGLVQADQYRTDRQGRELDPPILGNKRIAVARKSQAPGTEMRPVPLKQRKSRTLRPDEVARLARIGAALEAHFGYPLDIEFGVAGDDIFILQARPVTVSAVR